MMLSNLYKQKSMAVLYRVLIALGLTAVILLPLYLLWYPAPLNAALNIHKLILLIVVINVGLAALLTVLFFNPARKDHKLNMRVISLIQLIVFSVGFYYFVQVRPAWLVQHQDRVYVVQPAFAVYPSQMNAFERLKAQPWGKPELKTVKFSELKFKRNTQLQQSVAGVGIEYQPQEFSDYDQHFAASNAQPLVGLQQLNTQNEIDTAIKPYAQQAQLWLPLRSSLNGQDMVVLLDAQGAMLGVVALRPW